MKIEKSFILLGLILFVSHVVSQPVEAQCYKVAVFITSGVTSKQKPKSSKVAIAGVVARLRSGVPTLVEGSTVGFVSGKGKTIKVQSSGAVNSFGINGDITATPAGFVVSGLISYPTANRGDVPATLTVSALNLKLVSVGKRNSNRKKLKGRTSVEIVDLTNGSVLYRQRPRKFSKIRSVNYQWEAENCFVTGGNGGGVKR